MNERRVKNLRPNTFAGLKTRPVVEVIDAKKLDQSIDMLGLRFDALLVNSRAVRAMVYEARGDGLPDFIRDFASMFPYPLLSIDRNVFEIVTNGVNAWNAYPHEVLQGRSPQEIISQLRQNEKTET